MKYFFLFLLILMISHAGDSKEVTIGKHSYVFVTESYNEYSDKGIELKLYTKTQNRATLPLLSFTLENQSGGCGEKSTQEGSYDINGTILTLYTHWDRSGRAYDTPKGDRIQHYKIEENGTIRLRDASIYLETQAKNYDKESAIQYLYHAPKNEQEIKQLQAYIARVERIFKATFVQGEDANRLHSEVHKALMKKSQTRWQ